MLFVPTSHSSLIQGLQNLLGFITKLPPYYFATVTADLLVTATNVSFTLYHRAYSLYHVRTQHYTWVSGPPVRVKLEKNLGQSRTGKGFHLLLVQNWEVSTAGVQCQCVCCMRMPVHLGW